PAAASSGPGRVSSETSSSRLPGFTPRVPMFANVMRGVWHRPPTSRQSGDMTRVYADLAISADGFSTGPNQRADSPFGDVPDGGLQEWMFEHPDDNRAEIDAIVSASAFIMGRNMFG